MKNLEAMRPCTVFKLFTIEVQQKYEIQEKQAAIILGARRYLTCSECRNSKCLFHERALCK